MSLTAVKLSRSIFGIRRGELRLGDSRKRRFVCRSRKTDSRTAKSDQKPALDDVSAREESPLLPRSEASPTKEKRTGWSFFPTDEEREAYERAREELSNEDVPFIDLTNPAQTDDQTLPSLTRDQVLWSCFSVSGGIFVMAFLLRGFAERATHLFGNDPDVVQSLLSLTPAFRLEHVAIALASAGAVSVARWFLYNNWREFKNSTDRSNRQVLTPLNFGDTVFVSFIPGISEELLFRGGLIPSSWTDWRGVLISGMVFGALHRGGGRNLDFALWASAVGCLYGFAFLWTNDIYVPMAAHSFANLFSAMFWLSMQQDTPSEG